MPELAEMLAPARVLPVLTFSSVAQAERTCAALCEGGVKAVEITLRTECALAALAAVKKAFPGLPVGAGTVLGERDLRGALEHGADFAVSPGYSSDLVALSRELSFPFLPGVATASEVMRAREEGVGFLKFFPAVAMGGTAALKAFSAALADVRFCPTGGLSAGNYRDFLRLPNVVCAGGSWMADGALVEKEAWGEISARAAEIFAE